MPSRTPRLQFSDQVVTAVVVVHDGAPWLPECLAALRAQRRRPQRLVVVDTGSSDDSADLAEAAGEATDVVRLPRDTGLAGALAAGLAAADGLPAGRRRGPVVEWVWIVHDDCMPEPDALLELLAEADRSVSATVLGCKQFGLDGHLMEMGVSVDGSGRRRTGVEPHEVDQGQHDELRDVLAVSTAGMLVRRDVWNRLDGLDPTWPFHGEDVDFGWRANAAGERVVVVPRAVVRHAFALAARQGPAAPSARPPAVVRRRNELQVLWANAGSAVLPLLVVRAVLGGALLALTRLSGGDVAGAREEVVAVASALRHWSTVATARRRRRTLRVRSHAELRPLFGRASAQVRRDLAARLAGRWPKPRADGGPRRGWRDRPLLWLSALLVVLALVADRGVLSGTLHGGRLLPVPGGASDLWSAYRAGWHAVGLGSTAPTPPWVAVLAAVSTVVFGKPWLAVAVLMLGAVPLAGWSAYAAGSAVTASRWLRAWGALAYALLPVGLGAVAGGRLEVVVVVVLLPVTARALIVAVLPTPSSPPARPIAAGLLLALSAAFAPLLWAVLAMAGFAAVVVAVRPVGRALGRLALTLAVAFFVLLPWSWQLAAHPARALRGAGAADAFALGRAQAAVDVVALHPAGPAQPATWLVAGYLLAAVAALARASGRRLGRGAFAGYVVAAGAALGMSRLGVPGAAVDARYWTGVPLAVAGLCVLCCAVVAADGAGAALARHSFGWRQLAATLVVAAAVVGTVGMAVTWTARGVERPLTDRGSQLLPPFAAATVALPGAPRALVLQAAGQGVDYALVRSPDGPRLGDADVASGTGSSTARVDRPLAEAVARLAGGEPQAADLLAELGITQVVTRLPDDRRLPGLDRVDGLTAVQASGLVVRRAATPAGELVLLAPEPGGKVRAGADLPASARPVPLPATAGRAAARIRRGPAGRLLVLAEPADRHWRATLDGRPLARSTAYGWAQAWTVPAAGGRLSVSRASDGRGIRLLAQLTVLVLLAWVARPVRRPVAGPA